MHPLHVLSPDVTGKGPVSKLPGRFWRVMYLKAMSLTLDVCLLPLDLLLLVEWLLGLEHDWLSPSKFYRS